LQHLDVPLALQALLASGVPEDQDPNGYLTENGLDGIATSFVPTGHLALIPGAPGPSLLVDLDAAASVAAPELADSTAAVWLAKDDQVRERSLVAALGRQGVTVSGDRDTAAAHRAALAKAAPAWAMQLALVMALFAVLLAGVVILICASAARRSWTYDIAALELVGVSRARLRRAALLEQLVVAIAGVAVGAVMGLIGARLALPAIPMFLDDVSAPAVLRPTPWTSVTAAAVLTLAVLGAVGIAVGLALVRQVVPNRVQGGRQ
jgi:predicted lysophospholipase L1 biosynthesis ABC-type transport system permease subunit